MISIDGLSKRFGDRLVVDTVSFDVAPGELVVLVGGSGSGKTTTLRMINRLIEPTAGRVTIDGRDARSFDPSELRRRIGYVFQGIGLFPHMTIGENVAVTPRLMGWPESRIRARVDELLTLVELDPGEVRHRMPSQLSGGQQQRVGVARALAAEPAMMLLDEPFGALDVLTRGRLQEVFDRIRRELGVTGILVTHDIAEALVLGNRIGVMMQGRLVQIGRPRELAAAPVGPEVAALLDTPRRQAAWVRSIFEDGR